MDTFQKPTTASVFERQRQTEPLYAPPISAVSGKYVERKKKEGRLVERFPASLEIDPGSSRREVSLGSIPASCLRILRVRAW
jgi:hypothetical protein